MRKYNRKPAEVEALQLSHDNMEDLLTVMRRDGYQVTLYTSPPMRAVTGITFQSQYGNIICHYGDYIIKGEAGIYSPCNADVFEATYELVIEDGK